MSHAHAHIQVAIYVASYLDLSLHFNAKHIGSDSTVRCRYYDTFTVTLDVTDRNSVVLQHDYISDLFVLNNVVLENIGNVVCVSCIGRVIQGKL